MLAPGLTLVAAVGLSAAIIGVGPTLAERAIPADASAPWGDTIFNGLVFGVLLLIGIAGGAVMRTNALRPGRRPLIMLVVGAFVGVFGVTVTTGYSAIVGTLKVGDPVTSGGLVLLWGAGTVLLQALAEEVYFRGWLQAVLARSWGTSPAVVIAALAFSALHILGGAREPLSLINLFLGGLLFGVIAAYGRGILGAVAAHFAWNGAEQLVLGLDPNPGIGSFGSLFNFELVGAASWGGAEEGLNASFAMTLTLFVVLIPLVLLVRRSLADPALQRTVR